MKANVDILWFTFPEPVDGDGGGTGKPPLEERNPSLTKVKKQQSNN